MRGRRLGEGETESDSDDAVETSVQVDKATAGYNLESDKDEPEQIMTAPNGVRLSNKVKDGDVNALNVAAKRLKHTKLFPHDYHEKTKRQLQLSLLPTILLP
jgi:hypothetical protein